MLTDVRQARTLPAVTITLSLLTLEGCAMGAAADNPQPPASVDKRREVMQRETAAHTPPRTPARVPPADKASTTGEVPATIMNLFVDDLTLRAVVRREAISVVEAVQLDWPDGSLGCAAPHTAVIQVVTPGYRARLAANGQTYAYHSDLRGHFLVCDSGLPLPPAQRKVGDKPPAE